ncbi:hypothetical protein [Streptococcus ictaluri]|uniref:Uncharacterized protein n=1 Tax=Streptococcus ictaluri 707-05 TaxID=764299 RepID=G5K3I6_9STRE|nr:hypothetical protein [Streptococcus ictaluri]EHI69573.1 hypothetical protein STRIC_1356 [Streptococcus ictaluri 707-05]
MTDGILANQPSKTIIEQRLVKVKQKAVDHIVFLKKVLTDD